MIASAQTSNSKLAQTNSKLTVQSQNFADDSCAIRSLDWDRSRFDIESVSYTHLTLPTNREV